MNPKNQISVVLSKVTSQLVAATHDPNMKEAARLRKPSKGVYTFPPSSNPFLNFTLHPYQPQACW